MFSFCNRVLVGSSILSIKNCIVSIIISSTRLFALWKVQILSPLDIWTGCTVWTCERKNVDFTTSTTSRSNSFLLFSLVQLFLFAKSPSFSFHFHQQVVSIPRSSDSILSVREAISHRLQSRFVIPRLSSSNEYSPIPYSLGNSTSYSSLCVFLDGFHSLNTPSKNISLHIGIIKLSCSSQKPFLWMSRSTTRCPFHFRI